LMWEATTAIKTNDSTVNRVFFEGHYFQTILEL
jgi:hypothetical protein